MPALAALCLQCPAQLPSASPVTVHAEDKKGLVPSGLRNGGQGRPELQANGSLFQLRFPQNREQILETRTPALQGRAQPCHCTVLDTPSRWLAKTVLGTPSHLELPSRSTQARQVAELLSPSLPPQTQARPGHHVDGKPGEGTAWKEGGAHKPT